jgi:hypothetical protein
MGDILSHTGFFLFRLTSVSSAAPKKGGELGHPPPAVYSDDDSGFLGRRLSAECYGGHTGPRYFDGSFDAKKSTYSTFPQPPTQLSNFGRRCPLDIEKRYLSVLKLFPISQN